MNNNIGTDPSLISNIEVLDVDDKKASSNKKEKKPKKESKLSNVIKKVLFTVLIIALMGGVAYGLYFYLKLGRNKNTENINVVLSDKNVSIGDTLPSDLSYYGTITGTDVSNCSLDVASVNVNVPGEYKYYVTCKKYRFEGKIFVNNNLNISTKILYKSVGDTVAPEDFISNPSAEYTYTFVDAEGILNLLDNESVPTKVAIKVTGGDTSGIINAGIVVLQEKPFMYLTCSSVEVNSETNTNYITDKFAINSDRNLMGEKYRISTYLFEDEDSLKNRLNEYSDFVSSVDYEGLTLSVIEVLEDSTLDEEYGSTFPTTYYDTQSYYKNTKQFKCSI